MEEIVKVVQKTKLKQTVSPPPKALGLYSFMGEIYQIFKKRSYWINSSSQFVLRSPHLVPQMQKCQIKI